MVARLNQKSIRKTGKDEAVEKRDIIWEAFESTLRSLSDKSPFQLPAAQVQLIKEKIRETPLRRWTTPQQPTSLPEAFKEMVVDNLREFRQRKPHNSLFGVEKVTSYGSDSNALLVLADWYNYSFKELYFNWGGCLDLSVGENEWYNIVIAPTYDADTLKIEFFLRNKIEFFLRKTGTTRVDNKVRPWHNKVPNPVGHMKMRWKDFVWEKPETLYPNMKISLL